MSQLFHHQLRIYRYRLADGRHHSYHIIRRYPSNHCFSRKWLNFVALALAHFDHDSRNTFLLRQHIMSSDILLILILLSYLPSSLLLAINVAQRCFLNGVPSRRIFSHSTSFLEFFLRQPRLSYAAKAFAFP